MLLVRKPDGVEWGLPRTAIAAGEAVDDALGRVRALYQVEAAPVDLGERNVDGVAFSLHRVAIPGLPDVPGLELRLVRLAFLPKELGAADRALLDALLAP